MKNHQIAFFLKNDNKEAVNYLKKYKLYSKINDWYEKVPKAIPPDYLDLARLHNLILKRKVFTVLEFGIGFSTLVIANALIENKKVFDSNTRILKNKMRNNNFFELHCVDSSKDWIDTALAQLGNEYSHIIKMSHSLSHSGTFNGRACHYYDSLPDIIPDFIYLDGPDPKDVKSNNKIVGTWKNSDRTVMSADLLMLEPLLLPGTFILIDGRTANARFLQHHFYRNWEIIHNKEGDITIMELQEAPLGEINEITLKYCLLNDYENWK
jgi:hypothetical protein